MPKELVPDSVGEHELLKPGLNKPTIGRVHFSPCIRSYHLLSGGRQDFSVNA